MAIREFVALTQRELIRWVRAPAGIISSLLLPFFYLLLFGQSLNIGKILNVAQVPAAQQTAIYLGAPNYFSYFSVGMVGFILLMTSLFAGANVIFDRRFGTLKKLTSSPVPRELIFGARIASGIIRGLLFGGVVLGIAILFAHLPGLSGLSITGNVGVVGVVEILLAMMMVTALFSSIFVALGFVTEQIDSYFALVNLVNLPVLFSSNALFPQSLFPGWLMTASSWNPVSLAVDILRENMFDASSYYEHPPLYYLGVLAILTTIIVSGMAMLARWSLRPK
ncbi:MAG: ABC transporter permease [Thermoplasmata archaeon]|nr:ABC transporter permease [Thermoplasmata archaeon]